MSVRQSHVRGPEGGFTSFGGKGIAMSDCSRVASGVPRPFAGRALLFGPCVMLLSITAAHAQMSGVSFMNSSTANELVNGIFDNPTFERESGTQTLTPSGPTIATRYFALASADCGPACGPKTETLNTNYTVNWNVTAPNIYRIQIDTRRTAGLTCVDEGTGNCVSGTEVQQDDGYPERSDRRQRGSRSEEGEVRL